jgi:hypothetical protein
MGDHVMVVSTGRADRPAFVIECQKNEEEKWTEAMHLYPAMGLPCAHPLQLSLLARCHKDHIVAVYLLKATERLLRLSECTVRNSKACSANCITKMKDSFLPNFFREPEKGFSDRDYDGDIRPESGVINSWEDVRPFLQCCGFVMDEFESLPQD